MRARSELVEYLMILLYMKERMGNRGIIWCIDGGRYIYMLSIGVGWVVNAVACNKLHSAGGIDAPWDCLLE